MKKKVISMLMASAMTLSLLAGCGSQATETTTTTDSGETTTDAGTTTTDATAEAPAASGDATTINVYRCTFNLANPDSAQVQKENRCF